jgi:hypothetical protein
MYFQPLLMNLPPFALDDFTCDKPSNSRGRSSPGSSYYFWIDLVETRYLQAAASVPKWER